MKTQILIVALLATAFFTSCQKNDGLDSLTLDQEASIEKSTQIAINDIVVDKAVEESYFEVSFYAEAEKILRQLSHVKGRKGNLVDNNKGLRYAAGQCPDVSIDTTETRYPITITLDYGESTELQNGTVISGIIQIVVSAPRGTDGATRNVSYIDFSLDSIAVAGSCTEVFNGDNVATRVTTVTSDLTFTFPDGTVIDRTAEKVHEWLSGLETPMDHTDDTIQITGTVEVSNQDGDSYSKVTTAPLIKVGTCRHFVSGVVTFSSNGEVISVLDYGDGTCDELATLTTGGETIEIELHGSKPTANRDKQEKNDNRGKNGKGK